MTHCGMLVSENLVKYTSSKIYFHSISIGSHGFGDPGCLCFFESMILTRIDLICLSATFFQKVDQVLETRYSRINKHD
jgi:hypothetical protein